MLTELCAELRNYFLRSESDIHEGEYTIKDGKIDLSNILVEGQYFRIVGSVLNDGVHRYPAVGLADETFKGAVWAMAVPPSVVALASEIKDWTVRNNEALKTPYTSESFGGYSYSKATGTGGKAYSWQDQFSSRLNKWRRISVL